MFCPAIPEAWLALLRIPHISEGLLELLLASEYSRPTWRKSREGKYGCLLSEEHGRTTPRLSSESLTYLDLNSDPLLFLYSVRFLFVCLCVGFKFYAACFCVLCLPPESLPSASFFSSYSVPSFPSVSTLTWAVDLTTVLTPLLLDLQSRF